MTTIGETPAEETQQTEETEAQEEYGAPRGALAFVLLMLAGYAAYWFIIWFEIMVLRGA